MKNNITLLVCDMAGTIVNERGIIYTAIKSTLSHLGFFTPDNEEKNGMEEIKQK